MAAPAVAAATDSLVRTSGRPADDDVLAGVDDALVAALGALDAGLADDGGAAGAAEAQQAAAGAGGAVEAQQAAAGAGGGVAGGGGGSAAVHPTDPFNTNQFPALKTRVDKCTSCIDTCID